VGYAVLVAPAATTPRDALGWLKTAVMQVDTATVYCNTCRKGWKQTRVSSLDPAEERKIFGD
jgi:hypothetical protein